MFQIVNPNLRCPEISSFYPGVKTNYISIILPGMIKYLKLNLDNATWNNVTICGHDDWVKIHNIISDTKRMSHTSPRI